MEKHSQTHEILRTVLESGTQESVKYIAAKALEGILTVGPAAPIASILAGAAKGIACALLKSASTVESKIDEILAEPLRTGMATVSEVLTVSPQTSGEHRERDRRLSRAFDNLERAYTFAPTANRPVVRVYQALVAALKRGGGQFVPLYVQDLRSISSGARTLAEEALRSASAIRVEEQEAAFSRSMLNPSHHGIEHEAAMVGMASIISEQRRQITYLQTQADELNALSKELDEFCNFVTALSETNRSKSIYLAN